MAFCRGLLVKLLEFYSRCVWPIQRNFVSSLSKRCKNCIVSEKYCTLTDGLCQECSNFTSKEEPKSMFSIDNLTQVLESHAVGDNEYDATLLLSGGKDSAYILNKIKTDYPSLKLLCLTINNGFMSPLALKNVQFTTNKLKADLLVVNSHADEFIENFRQAFLEMKEGKGGYETVDFADGSLIFKIAEETTRAMNIPMMIGGLSWVQIQKILKSNEFTFPNSDFTTVYPLAVWRTDEQEIRAFVREHDLLLKGSDSPIVSNHQLILPLCVVDVLNKGYCSFEPEFAQLIREGKSSRKPWLYAYEFLEYMSKKGFLNKEAEKILSKLNLTLKDVLS